MRAVLVTLSRLAAAVACTVAMQGCAAKPGPATAVAPVDSAPPQAAASPDSGRVDSAATPAAAVSPALPAPPPEATSEIVDAQTRDRRKILLTDMTRLGLVRELQQGPPGVLRVAIGDRFYEAGNKDFYFGKLATAYYAWTEPGRPLVIELWDRGRQVGRFASGTFELSEAPPPRPRPSPYAAAEAEAETPRNHAGIHGSVGLGGGWLGVSCDGCSGVDDERGLSGFASVAGSVLKNVLLGVDATGWTKKDGNIRLRGYSLMLQATAFLSESSGLFLAAGAGLVGYHQDAGIFGSASANGLGVSGRLGYELPVARRVALIPYVGYLSTIGGAEYDNSGVDVRVTNIQIGLGLGGH